VDSEGRVIDTAGEPQPFAKHFTQVLSGQKESMSVNASSAHAAAGARCGEGMIQVVVDKKNLAAALNLSGLNEALSFFHVGSEGSFDFIRNNSTITYGAHQDASLALDELAVLQRQRPDTFFTAKLFGNESLCLLRELDEGLVLLTQLPVTEVYANRDAQAYENGFADILLFAVIYVLISLLVQSIVVHNLQLVNLSLARITSGHLDEVVNVRDSSEFASLSNDINQTVSVLKGYIAAAEKRIEQELEFARTIQDSALPKNFNFPRKDFELFASMDPAKEVGGDFYDFFFVDQNKLAMVIADVSGKGIPAALFMMRSKTAIRGLAESGQTPSEILYRANNTLCEGNDAEMFVTVWLGIIDLETGLMKCANAGHEYPVIMGAGRDFEVLRDKHGLALAAMEEMRFREYEVQMNPGDRLFVYTDGIPEAIDEQVEQYGMDRLVEVLNGVKDARMESILPVVRKNIADFAGNAEQFDDITMLGFTYFGNQPREEQ
jgi:serine phosphatase RsbU (regulator of sigma subunit)